MKNKVNRICDRRGLGLVEVVISSAFVGVMLVGALNSVGMVFRMRKVNADRLIAPALASQLMGEIMAMPYEDPQLPGSSLGPESGESSSTRAAFDDVDDYNNWSSSDAKSKSGTALAGYTGWSQQVTVTRCSPLTAGSWTGADVGLKKIVVTVTSPGGVQTQQTALRAKEGALEQPQSVDVTAVTWLGAELRCGASTRSQFAGAAVTNHATDAP